MIASIIFIDKWQFGGSLFEDIEKIFDLATSTDLDMSEQLNRLRSSYQNGRFLQKQYDGLAPDWHGSDHNLQWILFYDWFLFPSPVVPPTRRSALCSYVAYLMLLFFLPLTMQ